MKGFIQRLLEYLVTAWVIITVNFLLPRLVPGDPLLYLTGEASGDVDVMVDEVTREKLAHYYNLDQPLPLQYWHYLTGIFTGDLGYSLYFKTSVVSLIWQTLPWTIFLVANAVVWATVGGTILGVLSAWWRGSLFDQALLLMTTVTMAIPAFLLAILLQILFGIKLDLFPISGAMTVYQTNTTLLAHLVDIIWHAILPITTLTLMLIAETYLLVRNSIITILGADFIFVARLKGVPEWRIMYHHALRNVWLPLFTQNSLRLGMAVSGMIFVETVFSYPGMGNLMYRSVTTHDYPVTQGVFLIITLTVLLINFVVEMLYQRLDPRLQ